MASVDPSDAELNWQIKVRLHSTDFSSLRLSLHPPWLAQITLRVSLAENDVSSMVTPPPLYLQLSRQSYLHTLVSQIRPLWQHVLPPGEHIPWFSYNSLPLKWYEASAEKGPAAPPKKTF